AFLSVVHEQCLARSPFEAGKASKQSCKEREHGRPGPKNPIWQSQTLRSAPGQTNCWRAYRGKRGRRQAPDPTRLDSATQSRSNAAQLDSPLAGCHIGSKREQTCPPPLLLSRGRGARPLAWARILPPPIPRRAPSSRKL